MLLHQVSEGAGNGGVPLLIVHGLFGAARNWRALQKRLATQGGRKVVAVDLRNHGNSFWDDDNSYPALAGDLDGVIAAHGGQADVLGHSMGGKAAMALALSAPARVRRLIVADIAPVAYDHSQAPLVQAMQALDLSALTRRSEADRQLAAQLSDPTLRAFLLQSLTFGPGGARWQLNLAALADEMPKIMGFPRFDTPFDGPTLMLSGARSNYVTPKMHPEIRRLFPRAQCTTIPEAGHWLHAENPKAFLAAVDGFLPK